MKDYLIAGTFLFGLLCGPPIVLALLSIPYFGIFPDHHVHLYDIEGTPEQKAFLALRRSRYRRLGMLRRIKRAFRFGFVALMEVPTE